MSDADLSKHELWYGRQQEPTTRTVLNAGELTVEIEEAEIRSVRIGDAELLRGVYMAVRDERWDTVAGTLSDYEVSHGDDGFAVSFEMAHSQPPLSFRWRGRIDGDRSGVVSYTLDGVADTDFSYCRIGFCLLHPPQYAGHRYRGSSDRGTIDGMLPVEIGPQLFERGLYWPLFASVSELELSIDDGSALKLTFEGDLFEMEDQRNWTDGSFKTYCTPMELGYPFDARTGQAFRQRITFEVVGRAGPAGAAIPGAGVESTHRVELAPERAQPLPTIGLALPRAVDHHSDSELALLRAVHPGHLRVELVLDSDSWAQRLASAAEVAAALSCPLEVAAFAADHDPGRLDRLIDALAPLPVARLLVFSYEQEMTDPAMTRRAHERVTELGLELPVIGGTDLWFAELNRARPDAGAMDGLVYTITPQVHTFDEESIAQSLEAQPDTVRTAAGFASGLPIVVSPITLRPRDPVQIDDFGAALELEELPFSVDPRQSSLFAAAWTVGSIAALAGAGAASLTYYETVGWRGIIAGDRPLPRAFTGAPAQGAFAVFHVLADILELGPQTKLTGSSSASPSEVCALALSSEALLRVLVANLTPATATVEIVGLPAGKHSVRTLDERTANHALADPFGYRSRHDQRLDASGPIELAPFAITRIDVASAHRGAGR